MLESLDGYLAHQVMALAAEDTVAKNQARPGLAVFMQGHFPRQGSVVKRGKGDRLERAWIRIKEAGRLALRVQEHRKYIGPRPQRRAHTPAHALRLVGKFLQFVHDFGKAFSISLVHIAPSLTANNPKI